MFPVLPDLRGTLRMCVVVATVVVALATFAFLSSCAHLGKSTTDAPTCQSRVAELAAGRMAMGINSYIEDDGLGIEFVSRCRRDGVTVGLTLMIADSETLGLRVVGAGAKDEGACLHGTSIRRLYSLVVVPGSGG